MKRKIITIDEELCTGCGACIPDCPEGALQLIEGKARLVSDRFCDGLGACIGTCPEGAITIIEREAEPYQEKTVMATIVPQGQAVVRAHLEHLLNHGETALYEEALEYLTENHIPVPAHQKKPAETCGQGTCPGAAPVRIEPGSGLGRTPVVPSGDSELRQWPVQLRLVNPTSSYFENADLLIAADCVPFAYAGFHQEFLRNRVVIIFCPKLDAEIDEYVEKLAEILKRHTIRSITVVKMEVPCCTGTRRIVDLALLRSQKTIPVEEYTISRGGAIL